MCFFFVFINCINRCFALYSAACAPAEIKFDSTMCQLSAVLFISNCLKYLQTTRGAYDQNFIRTFALFARERRLQKQFM